MRNSLFLALGVCACVAGFSSPLAAATINVAAGGNLQQAITNAQPGDTIELARGVSYVGNFTLVAKGGSAPITIRTSGDAGLPGIGGRIGPSNEIGRAHV